MSGVGVFQEGGTSNSEGLVQIVVVKGRWRTNSSIGGTVGKTPFLISAHCL